MNEIIIWLISILPVYVILREIIVRQGVKIDAETRTLIFVISAGGYLSVIVSLVIVPILILKDFLKEKSER